MNLSDALSGKHDGELNRIAAELAGYTDIQSEAPMRGSLSWRCSGKLTGIKKTEPSVRQFLPAFVFSLDAVAQIESGLNDEQKQLYEWVIIGMLDWDRSGSSTVPIILFSARYRVVALVLTLRPGTISN